MVENKINNSKNIEILMKKFNIPFSPPDMSEAEADEVCFISSGTPKSFQG